MQGIKILFLWAKDFWLENYKCQLLRISVDYQLTWKYYPFRTPNNVYNVESVLQINYGQEVKVAS